LRDEAQRPIVTFRRMDGIVTVETWAQGVHGEVAISLAELRQLVNFLGDMTELPWNDETPPAQSAARPEPQPRIAQPAPPPTRTAPAYVDRPTWAVSEPREDEGGYPAPSGRPLASLRA
jgi:hypothetical protein